MNRCYNCKFWATTDSGYSNYTVIETQVHCLKSHFEERAESYSWKYLTPSESDDPFFKQAETCEDFKELGINETQIQIDVEGQNKIEDWKDDPDLYSAAQIYGL